MAATVFDFVAEQLESRSDLEKLEARGTVRIALKESGLDAQTVTAEQMLVVLEKVLPGELETRGVGDATAACGAMAVALKEATARLAESAETSPEEIFRRLAGR
jgi:predicted RNA methylase